jgi:hypothetical protein
VVGNLLYFPPSGYTVPMKSGNPNWNIPWQLCHNWLKLALTRNGNYPAISLGVGPTADQVRIVSMWNHSSL